MILIADSSALIALSIVDKLEVLEKLFGEVFVPRAVYKEVYIKHKEESVKLHLYCKDKVLDISSFIDFNVSLGRGESEAIIFYREKNANLLLCDDKKAKKFARNFAIKVIGSLGVLLRAKEENLIKEIKPLIEALKRSKVFIDDKTCNLVLQMANEL